MKLSRQDKEAAIARARMAMANDKKKMDTFYKNKKSNQGLVKTPKFKPKVQKVPETAMVPFQGEAEERSSAAEDQEGVFLIMYTGCCGESTTVAVSHSVEAENRFVFYSRFGFYSSFFGSVLGILLNLTAMWTGCTKVSNNESSEEYYICHLPNLSKDNLLERLNGVEDQLSNLPLFSFIDYSSPFIFCFWEIVVFAANK